MVKTIAKVVDRKRRYSLHSLKLSPITPPFAAKTSTVSFMLCFIIILYYGVVLYPIKYTLASSAVAAPPIPVISNVTSESLARA